MNFERLRSSLRLEVDAQALEIGVESGLLTRGDLDRLEGEGETVTPEVLVRRGLLTPAGLARLQACTRHLERAVILSLRLPPHTPPEVHSCLRRPGSLVGKYVRVEQVGKGGMSTVHRAWDTELSRWVALKLLTETADPSSRERFLREARTAAALDHPGIIPIYEAGQAENDLYIAMKLVETVSLRDLRLKPGECARIVREAALAVHAAHQAGIIHRDLKPGNILVDPSGRVFVSDFGIAREIQVDARLTASGSILGTPTYMAPEQAMGKDVARRASDIYSLGATLYELLAGRPPFEGESVYALLKRIVEEEPPALRRVAPHVDSKLETIVAKCLEKDPARRYDTALDLAEDLRRYEAGEPLLARRRFSLARMGVLLALLAGLGLAGGAAWRTYAPGPMALEPGLAGEYYQLPTPLRMFPEFPAAQTPDLRRVDPVVDFDLSVDGFLDRTKLCDNIYVRWTGVLRIPADGRYVL